MSLADTEDILVTCRAWFVASLHELAHEYDFGVKNIAKFEICDEEECNFVVFCSLSL